MIEVERSGLRPHERFALLLDRLSYSPARNTKVRLLAEYLRATPDPDRGWALAALTDGLDLRFPWRRILSDLIGRKVDPELYRLSRDYVGDTAETVALLWHRPDRPPSNANVPAPAATLSRVIEALSNATRAEVGGGAARRLAARTARSRCRLTG